jgi:RNA polymerase sigma-70 factor, ECF subfamily
MSLSITQFWERYHALMSRPSSDLSTPHSVNNGAGIEANLYHEFEAFFWRYEPPISRYLKQILGDEMAANDICQETFFRAWSHFPHIKDHPQVRTWLYRVATNLVFDLKRYRASHPESIMANDLVAGASDPGRRIVNKDLVTKVLQTLPMKHRSVLILFDVHGYSGKEIADLLGMSTNAVKMTLFRARKQFREEYEREVSMQ